VVPPSRGTFRFFIEGASLHDQASRGFHRIRSLYVDEHSRLAGIPPEATTFSTVIDSCKTPCYWTYFLKLVPTTSNEAKGYQLAGTRHFQSIQQPSTYLGNLVVHYETSALRMVIKRSKLSWLHSLTSGLGLIGGAVAIMGVCTAFFSVAHKTGTVLKA